MDRKNYIEIIENIYSDSEYVFVKHQEQVLHMIHYYEQSRNEKEPVSYNILIIGDNEKQSEEFYMKLLEAASKSNVFEKGFARCSLSDLLLQNISLQGIQNKCSIVIVNKAKKELFAHEKWSEIEKQFEDDKVSDLIKILCVDSETAQYLKETDEHFFYQVFSHAQHILLQEVNSDHIYQQLLQKLTLNHYTYSQKFCEDIKKYIDVVYPKAKLKDMPFVKDLYGRIVRNILIRENAVREADENCVPPYKKQEDVKTEQLEEPAQVKKTENKLKVPNIIPQEIHFDGLENGNNVLILSMSKLPQYNKGMTMYCMAEAGGENGTIACHLYQGISQLEPGTKFFLSEMAKRNIKPDNIKIIVLSTDQTLEPEPAYDQKSAIDVYCENIMNYLTLGESADVKYQEALEQNFIENGYKDFRFVSYADQIKELYQTERNDEYNSSEKTALENLNRLIDIQIINMHENPLESIMNILNKMVKNKPVNLYMDLQGGSRTFMFTMFATITLMREKNVFLKDMYAIQYVPGNDIHPIEILNNEYAIMDLVSGIRSFTRYGKVDELKMFLKSRGIAVDQHKDSEKQTNEEKLLEIMERIDGYMQINNPMGFADDLEILAKDDAFMLKSENYQDDQFKLIVGDLRDVYAPIITPNHTVLDQIKWFGEKAFTTSSLTFIEDKIPAFMLINDKNPIIKVQYDTRLSASEISKKCGGRTYYRPENNIFNFAFKNIVQDRTNSFYQKICDNWAEEILDSYKEIEKLDFLCGDVIKYLKADELYKDLKKCLLNIEYEFTKNCENGMEAWSSMKLGRLAEIAGYSKYETFKNDFTLNYDKDKKLSDAALTRKDILDMFSDTQKNNKEKRDKIRISVILDYLKLNKYSFQVETDKLFIKECISKALYAVLFNIKISDDTKKGIKESFVNIISDILQPIVAKRIQVLENVKVKMQDNNINFSDHYEQNQYRYDLWKGLIHYCANLSPKEIDDMVNGYVVTNDLIEKFEKDLDRLCMETKPTEKYELSELVKFAETYTKCRAYKDDIKKKRNTSKIDSGCSYENLQLYAQVDTTIRGTLSQYLYVDKDMHCLDSIAGVSDFKYDNWLTLNNDNISEEKKKLLNTCIHFYKAFKTERNTTNHAEENADNHMDYRHTKKGISVFVELCKRLSDLPT